MPHRPPAVSRFLLVALLCIGLPACERDAPSGTAIGVAARPAPQAARKPVDAVHVLRDRLLARDGASTCPRPKGPGTNTSSLLPATYLRVRLGRRCGRFDDSLAGLSCSLRGSFDTSHLDATLLRFKTTRFPDKTPS